MKTLEDKTCAFESKAEVSRVFGVKRTTVDSWVIEGCPHVNGKQLSFPARELIDWYVARKTESLKKLYDRKLGGNDSTVALKEQQLRIKIEQEELNLYEQRKKLIPLAHVEEFMETGCNHLQRAGNLLSRTHGEQAQEILNEALSSWQTEFERRFKREG